MASQVSNGKGFEWAVGIAAAKIFGFKIHENSAAENNRNCFYGLPAKKKKFFESCACKAVNHIKYKEFNQIPIDSNEGSVRFLSDTAGQTGDVRDIVIIYADREIGISCKTNHEAYKHSRLSGTANFVKSWGLRDSGCSEIYFQSIKPIFDELAQIRKQSNRLAKWSELDNVPERFYWPILDAFSSELERIQSEKICNNLVRYLVGSNDFYKVISRAGNKEVEILGFNLYGSLSIRRPPLPNEIINIRNKNGSQFSKTVSLNRGWSFNFRIHNASSKVESSLKFDINAVGLPTEIYRHIESA